MPIFKVFRYNPEKDDLAAFKTYELPEAKSMTVLEGLYYIMENLDPSLAFRILQKMSGRIRSLNQEVIRLRESGGA